MIITKKEYEIHLDFDRTRELPPEVRHFCSTYNLTYIIKNDRLTIYPFLDRAKAHEAERRLRSYLHG